MNRAAQALVLTAIGGVALRVGITDEYANYVNAWMRWPLVVSGALLVALAATAIVGRRAEEDHPTGPVAWLLMIPVVIGFVIQPPALGSYVADRRANELDAARFDDAAVAPLGDGESVLPVSGFVARAAVGEGSSTLEGATVRLTGFVTHDGDGGWYVTRLSIACCAADAAAFRVLVEGEDAPPEEQWVEVVGTWVEGTGTEPGDTPVISATEVAYVDKPKRPYE